MILSTSYGSVLYVTAPFHPLSRFSNIKCLFSKRLQSTPQTPAPQSRKDLPNTQGKSKTKDHLSLSNCQWAHMPLHNRYQDII